MPDGERRRQPPLLAVLRPAALPLLHQKVALSIKRDERCVPDPCVPDEALRRPTDEGHKAREVGFAIGEHRAGAGEEASRRIREEKLRRERMPLHHREHERQGTGFNAVNGRMQSRSTRVVLRQINCHVMARGAALVGRRRAPAGVDDSTEARKGRCGQRYGLDVTQIGS